MSKLRDSKRYRDLHSAALALYDGIWAVNQPERVQSLAERKFGTIPGAQWLGPFSQQFANKPMLEVNLTHLALIRVEDEWRNNRITVNFTAKSGEEDDELADTCSDLFRADEQDSTAQEAYDNAVQEAIGGGMGAWRLRAVYEDEYDDEDDKQRIRIEPIYDADQCVFFDLDAKRQDKADAKHCFVLTSMTHDAYEDAYGESPASWPKLNWTFEWRTQDAVYVAEYYKVEERAETVYTFTDISGEEERVNETDLINSVEAVEVDGERDDDATLKAAIKSRKAIGTKKTGEKRVKRKAIHKYILSGSGVLEDLGILPGRCIPIIPCYGKRWYIDNVERFMGHVRLSMDPQRLFNMQLSKLGEISATSGVSKPIFTPEQIGPHGRMWAEDNVKNYPYMLINPVAQPDGSVMPMGPVGMSSPPDIPPVTAALFQIVQGVLGDLLGSAQAPEEIISNASGKAVNMTQQRQDARAFIYLSNAAKAMRRCGEVWLDMAREIYVEESREMKGVGAQGQSSKVVLSKPVLDGETGQTTYESDMTKAKCDVTVDVGPSSSAKRQALVQALTGVLQVTQDPEQASVLTAMILRNVEGEGLADLHEFERKKLLTMGIGEPTDQDKADAAARAQGQQQDPNDAFLYASAQKAQADAAKSLAGAAEAQDKGDWYKAQSIEILSAVANPMPPDGVAKAIADPQFAPAATAGQQPPAPLQSGVQGVPQ